MYRRGHAGLRGCLSACGVSDGHGFSPVGGVFERRSFRLATGGSAVIARFLRLFGWFLLGVALAFFWLVPARAETRAADAGAGSVVAPSSVYFNFGANYQGPTFEGAMQHCLTNHGPNWCGVCSVTIAGNTASYKLTDGGQCPGGYYQIQRVATCPPGSSQQVVGSGASARAECVGSGGYTCPPNQNWTLSGNQCTRPDCDGFTETRDSAGVCRHCIAGHYRSQLQYYSYPDPSPDRNYAILTGNSGAGGDVPATACYDGCTVDLANSTDYRYSGGGGPSGHWTFNGAPKQTGAACSAGGGTDAAPVPEKTPEANCVAAGMSYGTVNGTVVCVPHGTTQERKVAETTGPGGGKTTTTETRVCTGGSCNSTTTVTNVNGGASGTATDGTTTSQTEGDEGSALQGDGGSECEVNPLTAACLGGPAEREGMASGSGGGGSGIQAVALGGGAFCPADSVISISGRTVAIPWTHACQLCGYVRPLVVLFGWLIAGYFVVSGLRS